MVEETRATAAWVLGQLLHVLHPFMPFLTEELWQHLTDGKGQPLIASAWPAPKAEWSASEATDEMEWVIRLISEIRAVRVELNVPPAAKLELYVKDSDSVAESRIATHGAMIGHLARLENIHRSGEVPKGAVDIVVGTTTVALPLAGVVDVAKEKARLEKDDAKLVAEVTKIEKKLGNAEFVGKAPEEVVVENRERLAELAAERAKIQEALTRLAGL